MPFFLPQTSHNLRNYLARVEDNRFPELAAQHDQLNHTISSHWNALRSRVGGAGEEAQGWAQRAVDGVERSTGLRVGDAVRRGQERVEREKEKLQGGLRATDGQKMEVVGYVVEQRPVAEIVAPVDDRRVSIEGKRAV
jgi:organizing structure protein 2